MDDLKLKPIEDLYYIYGFNAYDIYKIKKEEIELKIIKDVIHDVNIKTNYLSGDFINSKLLFKKIYKNI